MIGWCKLCDLFKQIGVNYFREWNLVMISAPGGAIAEVIVFLALEFNSGGELLKNKKHKFTFTNLSNLICHVKTGKSECFNFSITGLGQDLEKL